MKPLDHKDANASIMKFIIELVKAATSKDVSPSADLYQSLIDTAGGQGIYQQP